MCIDADQQRARATAKKRRWRQRQQRRQLVIPVEIEGVVIEALMNSGRLDDAASHDREQIGAEFAAILTHWAKQWL